MAIDASYTHRGRLLKSIFINTDSWGAGSYSWNAGSMFDCHLEEVSDDELQEQFGEMSRIIKRLYMDSLGSGVTHDKRVKVQRMKTTAYTWSTADEYEIVTIDDAGGRADHLQMFVRMIKSQ